MKLKGSTMIVTGGASGLGEACIRLFCEKGANTAILDFNAQRGGRIAAELGDTVIFCETDVTDAESVQAAVNRVVETFGAVHGVVNCAGVGSPMKVLGKKGPLAMNQFDKVVRINLTGTMTVLSRAAEQMVKNAPNEDDERGVVINTASVAAFEGQIGQAAYSASKAGVVGMTLPIAREFADYGIRVMTIAPGLFETPMLAGLPDEVKASLVRMIPFPKRLGRPEEFARLALHIVENPTLNGETIRLDSAIRMGAR